MSHSATYAPHALKYEEASWLSSGMVLIWTMACADLVFHIYFNNRYGYFRDEFDYIACGNHLAWGYVDQPPLIPWLIHICRAVLGDSLRSIRFIPAVASSLLVVQTALIAREFGGRRFALLLSAVAILIAPQYLSNGSLLTTNCLEPNLWMGCAYLAILAVKRNNSRCWLWFGLIAGIGLEEKYTIALFGLGITVGLLATKQRSLLDKWFWLGGIGAFAVFLPNALWNIRYHWPFLELMHNIRAEGRDVVLGAGQYSSIRLRRPFGSQVYWHFCFPCDSGTIASWAGVTSCVTPSFLPCTARTTISRLSIRCCSPPARSSSNQRSIGPSAHGSSPPSCLFC
jgi:4-amino-4-deoxy-L-arabinose transferase-like glycosyltransferase